MLTIEEKVSFSSMHSTHKSRAVIAQKLFGWVAAAKNYSDANDIARRLNKQGVQVETKYIDDNLFHVVLV